MMNKQIEIGILHKDGAAGRLRRHFPDMIKHIGGDIHLPFRLAPESRRNQRSP
jgi:hypothetical protein